MPQSTDYAWCVGCLQGTIKTAIRYINEGRPDLARDWLKSGLKEVDRVLSVKEAS